MNPNPLDVTWLDAHEALSLAELACVCALSAEEIDELVDYGALVPLEPATPARRFSADSVMPLREASRLRVDFDLDLFTVAIVLGYLRRIETLEARLRSLESNV